LRFGFWVELGKGFDPTELIGEESAAMRNADIEIWNRIKRATEDQVGRGHRGLVREFEHRAAEPRLRSAHKLERIRMDEQRQARVSHPVVKRPELLVVELSTGDAVCADRDGARSQANDAIEFA